MIELYLRALELEEMCVNDGVCDDWLINEVLYLKRVYRLYMEGMVNAPKY